MTQERTLMMSRIGRCLVLAVTLATCATAVRSSGLPGPEDRDPKAVAFSAALNGDWRGTLEYRDYSSDKRVTLPTTLEARPAEDGRTSVLKFRYAEGKGRFVEGTSTLRVDSMNATLRWESDGGKTETTYAIAGLDAFAEKRRGELLLTGPGTENDVKVEARQTITLNGDELTILRETRKPGAPFAFRNAYKFKRTSVPSPATTTPP